MFICKFCNEEFSTKAKLTNHFINTEFSHFSSKLEMQQLIMYTVYGKEIIDDLVEKYKSEEMCVHDFTKLGIRCSTYLELLGIKRSSKEERATKRYKQKYLSGIQEKYGENITNISQAKEVQLKKEKTYIENYGSYEAYLAVQRKTMKNGFDSYINDEDRKALTFDKIEQTCLTKYGNKNFGQGDVAKEKASNTRKDTVAGWDYEERLARTADARKAITQRGGYSSKPEKRIRHCLVELGIDFISNKFLWKYSFDMVIGTSFIIEVQGDMWHATPLKYKENDLIMGKILAKDIWEKDARKKLKAEENNYKMIYIWENEISKKNDIELIELVTNKLKEAGYVFN